MTEPRERLLIDIRELSTLTGIAPGTLFHWAAAKTRGVEEAGKGSDSKSQN